MNLLPVLLHIFIFKCVLGSPNGAPSSSCDSMVPAHGVPGQTVAAPYTITTSAQTYRCGESITVSLTATSGNFRGFLCQARTDVSAYSSTVGTMAPSGSVSMNQNCGLGRALTHAERADKSAAEFTWTPSEDHGSVVFVCSIVQTKTIFWIKETGTAITYSGGCETSSVLNTQSPANVTDNGGASSTISTIKKNDGDPNAAEYVTVSTLTITMAFLLQLFACRS